MDPCGFYYTGQAEDYIIRISNAPWEGEDACPTQKVLSNNLQIGVQLGGSYNQRIAVDIPVGNENYVIYGVQPNVVGTATQFSFNFYDSVNDLPGTNLIKSVTGNIVREEYIGYNAAQFYKYTVKFDEPVNLSANTKYWMEVVTDATYLEATTASVLGSHIAFTNSDIQGIWKDSQIYEGVYKILCSENLGLSDSQLFDFSYYPNPVKDILNIKTKADVKSVSVYNIAGQEVISNAKLSKGQLNISRLPIGTYVVKANFADGKTKNFKIIKK